MEPAKTSLPGPIALFQEAWKLFLSRIWLFISVFGVNIGLVIATIILVLLIGGGVFFLSGRQVTLSTGIVFGVLGVGAIVFWIYVSMWMQVAYILLLGEEAGHKGVRDLLQRARSLIGPFFLTSFIVSISIFGGYILLLIPGLMLAVWYNVSQYVVVHEQKKGLLAMHTSREYIRGRFWAYVWRILIPTIPFFLLGLFPAFLPKDTGHVFSAVFQILSIIVGPLYICYGYVMYQHLAKSSQPVTEVPAKDKKVYFGIPLAGVGLIILLVLYGLFVGY